jgi:hypothetical protein
MRITTFIGGSSVLLTAWLGFSFIREVPARSYPTGQKSQTAGTATGGPEMLVAARDEAPVEP